MRIRRLLCLVLVVTLAMAHWGRAAVCQCRHTAQQLPHVHLSGLTFGLFGRADHAENRHACGCCHRTDAIPAESAPDSPAEAPDTESPESDDVVYLPPSLDHDWRSESAQSPVPDLVAAPVATIVDHDASPSRDLSLMARLSFSDPPARPHLFVLTHAILI